MSTGMLPSSSSRQADGSFTMTDLSWASSGLEGSSTGLRSRMSSTHNLHIGSTQRSSRAMQNRQYANCHMAKYRWMGEAAAAHTRSMSDGSPWATYKREVEPKMPTVGGTSLSDVFRFTNEFYREGVRRLQYHHEMQSRLPGGSPVRGGQSPAGGDSSPGEGSRVSSRLSR